MSDETQLGASKSDTKSKAPASPVKKSKEAKNQDAKKASIKKLDPESAKLLATLREKANKKDYGRKVRDSELIHLGLSLIETSHLESLKDATYSEKDRLEIAHQEYQKVHGKLTLDQFIGRLLRGEAAMTQGPKG